MLQKWAVNSRARMNVLEIESGKSICSCGGEVPYEQAVKHALLISYVPDMYNLLAILAEEKVLSEETLNTIKEVLSNAIPPDEEHKQQ